MEHQNIGEFLRNLLRRPNFLIKATISYPINKNTSDNVAHQKEISMQIRHMDRKCNLPKRSTQEYLWKTKSKTRKTSKVRQEPALNIAFVFIFL